MFSSLYVYVKHMGLVCFWNGVEAIWATERICSHAGQAASAVALRHAFNLICIILVFKGHGPPIR